MKKFWGISGSVILIIIVKVLVKDFVIKDLKSNNANLTEYNKSIKTAKDRKDSIAVALKYDIINEDSFVDTIYNRNIEMNNSIIRAFEKGVERKEIDSILRNDYPYPIYSKYLDKIAAIVISRNQNFLFTNNDNKISKEIEFASCVKKAIGNLAEYTYVFNDNKNLMIYKDVSWTKNDEYVFARNGAFCFQSKNGERAYGKWKCLGNANFECHVKQGNIKDTLYFDKEHSIINSKHFARVLFE
jgi:hypothetical protein